jgi:PAS domain S-box-containing protein
MAMSILNKQYIKIKILIFFVSINIFFLFNSFLYAQKIPIDEREHDFFFEEVWTKDLNRSLSSIESLIQTSDGYIWIATNNGLFRYNGDRFVNYTGQNTPLFFNTIIHCLHEDINKTLWIGTNKGLMYYENRQFHFFEPDSTLKTCPISTISSDENGNVFVGAGNYGLFKIENGRKETHAKLIISNVFINCVRFKNNILWIGTYGNGVAKLVNNRFEYILKGSKISNDIIRDLQVDKRGNLWIATTNNGLVKYFNGEAKYYSKESGFPSNRILSIVESREGILWVGTGGGGLVRLNGNNIKIFDNQNGLTINAIRSLLIDKEGILWVGTSGGGLFRTKNEPIKTYTTNDGLNDNFFWCMDQDREGNIWIGSGDNGVIILTKDKIKYLTKKDGLPSNNARTILCDSKGRIWIGTIDNGVVMLDKGKKTYFNQKNGVGFIDTRVIFEDSKKRVWIAGRGSCKYYFNNQFYDYKTVLGNIPTPSRYITEDGNGTLYFGNGSLGVGVWDGKRVTWLTKKDGLLSCDILSIYCDNNNTVWIGTGNGLNRYKDGKISTILYNSQIHSQAVLNIQEDKFGYLWMSTFIGIISINKKEINDYLAGKRSDISYRIFGKLDGMVSTECNGGNQHAGLKSRDGRIWFPTMNGVAVITPSVVNGTNNSPVPPVVVDFFNVNDSSYDIFSKNINIQPGEDKLEFIFSAHSFKNPNLNRYKYMIEGLDHSWIDAGNRAYAIYNKIPPGDYVFRVIACNSDGIWNYEGARIAFSVKPAYYQTIWFVFILIFLALFIFFMIIYVRNRYFKRIRSHLEKVINQKTDQLEKELKEKKETEIELRESRDRLNFFVEGSKDGFWDWDIEKDIVYYNYNIEEILERTTEKLPRNSKEWINIFHIDDRNSITATLSKCASGENLSFHGELKIITESGVSKWLYGRGKIVAWNITGKPSRMAGSITDINERKKNEEEILKAKKIESIGLLAGGIAHDFNNLLTIILGNISLMRIKLQRHQEGGLGNLVDNTEKASIRAKDLTQQLLTFSKGGEPIIKTVKISKLLNETTSFSLRGSNVKPHFDIPEDLWNIEADEGQINQVLQNLVINARQAMLQGGSLYIHASNCIVDKTKDRNKLLSEGNYVQIRIKDTGPGIEKENLEKIFDPYFTTKAKGHGLGLFTSYSIIKKHGGDIKITSIPGEGAEFIFWIPASSNGSEVVTFDNILEKGTGRILILDDEDLIRSILCEMLINLGYEVSTSENGDETINKYRKSVEENRPFDLVIIDLTIPGGKGGVETTAELKQINPSVRTLVSTGYSNGAIISQFKDFGFDAVLNKPYVIEDVSRIVKKVLMTGLLQQK